jgi:hypothetical protein
MPAWAMTGDDSQIGIGMVLLERRLRFTCRLNSALGSSCLDLLCPPFR